MPARRLVLLVRSLHGGGMERMVLALAGAFAERGHRVSLLVAVPSGALRARVPGPVELVPLAKSPPLVGRAFALAADRGALREMLPLLVGPAPRMLSRLPDLVRYLREARPDALLAAGTQSNLAALWARRFRGVSTAIVVSERNTMSVVARRGRHGFRRAYPRLARRAYPSAAAIVAVSEGVADDLSRVAGIPRERIVRIDNPVVSAALFEQAKASPGHPWMAPGGPPVVLAAGRLHRQKDFPTLLRAFAQVRALRAARLVILGEGAERRQLERLARVLRVEADVALPGFVGNPYAWMARAAVFVLSSAWEGVGNVLVEALACGCPVVATDCPSGPAEILERGALGPLVPVGDPAALAEAIGSVLATPPDRERLRAGAARFSVDAAADRYLEVLLAACASPREGSGAAGALASHG
jgi:glycosyltransferase involved in cell wall biosynthesis